MTEERFFRLVIVVLLIVIIAVLYVRLPQPTQSPGVSMDPLPEVSLSAGDAGKKCKTDDHGDGLVVVLSPGRVCCQVEGGNCYAEARLAE